MTTTNEPATDSQLTRLRQLGCEPDHRLTKDEALHLILELKHHPEKQHDRPEAGHPETKAEAWRLRREVEAARDAVRTARESEKRSAEYELSAAIARRLEFWTDTCREPGKMRSRSGCPQVFDLYMKHGCRFAEPARGHVQEILDALDGAAPFWDRDHPELFYQTLEMNFGELLRHTL
jgi:hypothetical protein